jgi:hypothetical protein
MKHWLLGLLGLLGLLVGFAAPALAQYRLHGDIAGGGDGVDYSSTMSPRDWYQGREERWNGVPSTLPWFSLDKFNRTGIGYDAERTPTYRLSSLLGTRSCGDYNDYTQNGCFEADLAGTRYPAMRAVGFIRSMGHAVKPKNKRTFIYPHNFRDYMQQSGDLASRYNKCMVAPGFNYVSGSLACSLLERSYGPEAKIGGCTRETNAISASPVMLLDVDQPYSHPIDLNLKTRHPGALDLVVRAPDGSWLCDVAGPTTLRGNGHQRITQVQQGRYEIYLLILTRQSPSSYNRPLPPYQLSIKSSRPSERRPFPDIDGEWRPFPKNLGVWAKLPTGNNRIDKSPAYVHPGPTIKQPSSSFEMVCDDHDYVFSISPTLKFNLPNFPNGDWLQIETKDIGSGPLMLLVYGPDGPMAGTSSGADYLGRKPYQRHLQNNSNYKLPRRLHTSYSYDGIGCDALQGQRQSNGVVNPVAGEYAIWVGLRKDYFDKAQRLPARRTYTGGFLPKGTVARALFKLEIHPSASVR